MIIFGIDPGISGAVAAYDTAERMVTVFSVPFVTITHGKTKRRYIDIPLLARVIKKIAEGHEAIAYVEHVNAMPKQGVASSFRFGESKGIVLGILAALGIATELVHSAKWKRHFGIGADKKEAILKAGQLYPNLEMQNEHECEAVLLMHYGLERHKSTLI